MKTKQSRRYVSIAVGVLLATCAIAQNESNKDVQNKIIDIRSEGKEARDVHRKELISRIKDNLGQLKDRDGEAYERVVASFRKNYMDQRRKYFVSLKRSNPERFDKVVDGAVANMGRRIDAIRERDPQRAARLREKLDNVVRALRRPGRNDGTSPRSSGSSLRPNTSLGGDLKPRVKK